LKPLSPSVQRIFAVSFRPGGEPESAPQSVLGRRLPTPNSDGTQWLSAVSCAEKQKGAQNFRTEGLKDLKKLTIPPSDRHSLWLEVLAGV
jgi:hypothetical protein